MNSIFVINIDIMDDKLRKYYKWYEDTYGSIINLKKIEDKADLDQNKWLKKAVQNFSYKYSSIWRHEILSSMRYYLFPKKTEYICTSFKITRTGESSLFKARNIQYKTIYALLYTSVQDSKFKFEFVSTCPTFKSADGEYRHRFITVDQVLQTRQNNLEEFEELEDYFLKQLHNEEVLLEVNHIIPDAAEDQKKQIAKSLNKEIDKMRFAITFYLSTWIVDFSRYIDNKMENHLADGFREAMFSHKDIDFQKKWIKKITIEKYNAIAISLIRFKKDLKQRISVLELGQKFIPLTVYDVEDMDNLKLAPWREMYVSSIIGNLVINGISPSFPIFDDWFFIQGNSIDFWDNRVSHIKLDHSEIATEIVKKLETTRKGTYVIDPIKKKEMYLSFSMEGLSEAIEIPMDYAEQEIILADMILCSLTEHVGRTLADIPKLLMIDDYSKVYYGPLFKSFPLFAKYIFDDVYSLFCLNTKLGIVHGDIHLNNTTLFFLRPFINLYTGEWEVINPHVIYRVVDEDYIFPHHGSTSGIIDYSRAFMDREHLLIEFGEDKADEIIYHQRKRMLRVLEREIPDFYGTNADKFQIAMLEDFDTFYKIFTAVDIYKLTRGIMNLVQMDILGNKIHLTKYGDQQVVSKQIIPLLEKINNMAYNYLTINFNHLFNRKLDKDKLPNPNLLIIKECFKFAKLETFEPPIYNGEKFISLVDFFSSDNELKYDSRHYDKFPETIKFDYVIKNKIPAEEMGLKNYQEYQEYLKKEPVEEKLEKIQEDIIEEKAERRGSPIEISTKVPTFSDVKKFNDISTDINTYYFET